MTQAQVPLQDGQQDSGQIITLGGGCFWCTEAVFSALDGVLSVESGYCNGEVVQPSYEAVCTGQTGHTEVIRVRFDPARIGLADLLEVFFFTHDPTTLNRQGHDAGTQYRSGIYTHSASQGEVAHQVMSALAPQFDAPLVTEVESERNYWPAEDYHQRYYALNPRASYCAYVISPKLAKLRQKFSVHLRKV